MSILDRLPGRQPYVRRTTDRELIVNRPHRTDGYQRQFFENSATPEPEPLDYVNPNQQPEPEDGCICRASLAVGEPNPTCPPHGWWNRDPAVLDLADLTRELGSWEAARRMFGGGQ